MSSLRIHLLKSVVGQPYVEVLDFFLSTYLFLFLVLGIFADSGHALPSKRQKPTSKLQSRTYLYHQDKGVPLVNCL